MTVLVVVEHDRGVLAPATFEALTFGRSLGTDVHAVTIGATADALAAEFGAYGAAVVHQAHHDLLADYGPDAWADTVVSLVASLDPVAVVASGTDRPSSHG